MKAIVFSEYGGPEVLRYAEVREPEIGADGVLVRVRACALNHLDLWVRRGLPGITIPLPRIPGSDISGEVARVGENVSSVRPGERVVLSPGISCGHCVYCLRGDDNFCREYTLFGYKVDGGYAEYVASPAVNVIPMPANLSFEQAAAIPLVFLTAWHMLITRAQLRPDETVLVLGAGSGVGSAAIQIAKVAGARVIATSSSDAKLQRLRLMAVDEVVNYKTTPDWDKPVRAFTKGVGADHVIEVGGAGTLPLSSKAVRRGGHIALIGVLAGRGEFDPRLLMVKSARLQGIYVGSREMFEEMNRAISIAGMRPVIDRVFEFGGLHEALQYMESGSHFGKICVRI